MGNLRSFPIKLENLPVVAKMSEELLRKDLLSPITSNYYTSIFVDNGAMTISTYEETEPRRSVVLAEGVNISYAAAGYDFCVALDEEGNIYSWGKNNSGQLGDWSVFNRRAPARITSLNQINFVSCGSSHCIAVDKSGRMFTWGENSSAQLGIGSTNKLSTITEIPFHARVAYVSCGSSFSTCIDENQDVYSWGKNLSGELGHGDILPRLIPTKIENLPKIYFISCGGTFCICIDNANNLYSWGSNNFGQLGIGSNCSQLTPTKVENIPRINFISCGLNHVLATTHEGKLYSWGANHEGKLGLGTLDYMQSIPQLIDIPSKIFFVSTGAYHSVALDIGGNIYHWGGAETNNLPLFSTKNVPTLISGIRLSSYQTVAIKNARNVM